MPTKRQIEQLKNIKDPLTQRKYARLLQLPKELQDAIFATETADKIYEIGQKSALNDEQIWQYSYIIGMILLGDLHITEFIKTLQQKCRLPYDNARSLARQTNTEIFLPIKEGLKIVHKIPRWPRENETTAQPIPASPPQAQTPPIQQSQRPIAPPQPPLQERIKKEEENRMINLRK